jgi:hypothetical protein
MWVNNWARKHGYRQREKRQKETGFIKLQVTQTPLPVIIDSTLEIIYPNNVKLILNKQVDISTLKSLIKLA